MAKPLDPNAAVFVPQHQAPPAMVQPPQLVVAAAEPVADPDIVVAYANNFKAKHTAKPLKQSSAVDAGRTRGPFVSWSTVFDQDFIEGHVSDAAKAKLVGEHWVSIACHNLPKDKFCLAERKKGSFKTVSSPMFFCKVCYRVNIDDGAKTVTLTHIETD